MNEEQKKGLGGECETVKIVAPNANGYIVINADDFDPKAMKKYGDKTDDEEARKAAEEKAKKEAEERAKKEAEEKAKEEAEEKAKAGNGNNTTGPNLNLR